MTELKKGMRKFSLTGKVKLSKYTFAIDTESTNNPSYVYSKANIALDCGNGNVFTSLMGGHYKDRQNMIYALGTKKDGDKVVPDYEKKISVPFEERFNESVLSTIANTSFITIAIEKDTNGELVRKKFLAQEDAVKYLQNVLSEDMVLNVGGDISFRTNKDGETLFNLDIKNIYLNTYENPKYKSSFTLSVLSTSTSYDSMNIDEDGLLCLNCFVNEYVSKHNGMDVKSTFALPLKLYTDTKANENYKKLVTEYFRPMGDNICEATIEGEIFTGGNVQSVSLDEQSEEIKNLVAMGIISAEEIAKKGANNNSTIQMLMFTQPFIATDKDGKVKIYRNKEAYKMSDLKTLPTNVSVEVKTVTTTTQQVVKPIEQELKVQQSEDDIFNSLFN